MKNHSLFPFFHLLACAVVLLTGCSSTAPVTFDSRTARGDTLTVDRLNKRLARENVILHLRSGEERDVLYLRCSAESCRFVDSHARLLDSLPVANLRSIERREHVAGAIGGLFVGTLLVGGGAAVVGGLATLGADWRGYGAFLGGFYGGIAGGVGGFLYGAIAGWRQTYLVDKVPKEQANNE